MFEYIHSSFPKWKHSPEYAIFSKKKSYLKWSLLWNLGSSSNSFSSLFEGVAIFELLFIFELVFISLRRQGHLQTVRPTFDFPDRLEFFYLPTLRRRGRHQTVWLTFNFPDRLEFFSSSNSSKAWSSLNSFSSSYSSKAWSSSNCLTDLQLSGSTWIFWTPTCSRTCSDLMKRKLTWAFLWTAGVYILM